MRCGSCSTGSANSGAGLPISGDGSASRLSRRLSHTPVASSAAISRKAAKGSQRLADIRNPSKRCHPEPQAGDRPSCR